MKKTVTFISLYSRLMLGFWGLFFLALLIFNCLQFQLFIHSLSTLSERFIVPAFFACLFFYLIGNSLQTRLIVANTLLAIMVALYAGEFYLAYRMDVEGQRAGNNNNGVFDARDKLTVIKDMRANHINAYPIIRAENLLSADSRGELQSLLSAKGEPFLPMASIPGAVVVSCNETGQWQTYQADRHGFNNDDGQWNKRIVIGMVGDSFTHGSCVRRDQNMATFLGNQFGGVINLGVGGFGPLLELAALTEYLKPLRPPTVLWVFFEGNDLTEDLPREYRSPMLQNYLRNENYNQDLIHRPGDVDNVLRHYLDQKLTDAMNRVDGPYENLIRYLSLDRLREAIGVGPIQIGYNLGQLDTELALFHEIIKAADHRVKSWGGRLYLVYLPESERYFSWVGNSLVQQDIHKSVKQIAEDERIPFIDVTAAFNHDPSPTTLYVYPGSHFSPRGYRIAGSAITKMLNARSANIMRIAHRSEKQCDHCR